MKQLILSLSLILSLLSCDNAKKAQSSDSTPQAAGPAIPTFCADSAYRFCATQCAFGPRTMNSEGHEKCGRWIADKFKSYGLEVTEQKADLKGYDGTIFHSTNIIAALRPEMEKRIILAAHWDTRPWADNDPKPENHRKAIDGANDGASGVAVMLEIARVIAADTMLNVGIDFICFDAEDSGIPQWETMPDPGNTWALGSQYWATHPHKAGYKARYGILLDMVGGRGATFYHEGFSLHYAKRIVEKVWAAAAQMGHNKVFVPIAGGYITDDHVPVNDKARIPMIDIVPHHPDCQQSTFGPTWHTVDDNMENIDPATLNAVGQTVIRMLFNEFTTRQ